VSGIMHHLVEMQKRQWWGNCGDAKLR